MSGLKSTPLTFIIVSIAFLSGCSTVFPNLKQKHFVYLSDKKMVLNYTGKLNQKGLEEFRETFYSTKPFPRLLKISSVGGSAKIAMDMADIMLENNMDVHINKMCMSACANYIFLAGNRKFLEKDSLLVWHGGIQDITQVERLYESAIKNTKEKGQHTDYDLDEHSRNQPKINMSLQPSDLAEDKFNDHEQVKQKLLEKIQEYKETDIPELRIRSQKMYAAINVDPLIAVYGNYQKIPNPNTDTEDYYYNISGMTGFYYSLQDLEKMGVSGIELLVGKWFPNYPTHTFKVDMQKVEHQALPRL
ncbi:hypothetical protein [Paraglaciecola sp. L3A3]|uniref:hypothetical protein n=1 Tax=Paraglaciecola sp. L3A3 TaxID=2686358 RepID=UPI00131B5705|nr:hypothetical protein [Paraglaciecola sp. L3A3]